MTCYRGKEINIALIGFEFTHHIPAARKALQTLELQGINLEIKLWSARDGVKHNVLKQFPECEFLDAGKGWLGRHLSKKNINSAFDITLSDIEIKHFSYAYSRTAFFRDPRNITKNNKYFFMGIVFDAMRVLNDKSISVVFFVKLPHSLMDLAFYYAAQRLEISIVYTDGPFFGGDYVFPVANHSEKKEFCGGQVDFFKEFSSMMQGRNLNENLKPPHYQTADLSYMPRVPSVMTPFFLSQAEYVAYRITNSILLTRVLRRALAFMAEIASDFTRWYAKVSLCAKRDFGEKYILVLMQCQPEQTTSPSAADTPFEEERIAELAKRFPDYAIVVREHPANIKSYSFVQYRSIRSFRSLSHLKNVFYVLPDSRKEYKELLKGAFFAISTSGTVALESIQLGVPAVHLYRSFASGFPGVSNVTCVSEITASDIQKKAELLAGLTNDELISLCYKAASERPLVKGFLCGYHEEKYTEHEYIENASRIIYTSLSYALRPDGPD